MANTIDIREEYLAIVKRLLRAYMPDAEVWVYGSRAKGTAYDASDLDLVLRNPKNLTEFFPWQSMSRLREALSESDLPFLVDVTDWAGLTDSFREIITKESVRLEL